MKKFNQLPPMMRELLAGGPRSVFDPAPAIARFDRELEKLAISGEPGQIGRPQSQALVVGQVVEQGRGNKILVFHYKRKKQYKKLRGHRQGFTAVRITEIAVDGQKLTAPQLPQREAKPKRAEPVELETVPKAEAKPAKSPVAKKSTAKKAAAKKPAPKKKK